MKAGLLREFITIYRFENVQSPTGEITKQKKEIALLRAYRLKSTGTNKEVAKELFDTQSITFQIRYFPDIQDSDIISYRDIEYKITNIDENIWDRTLKITVQKINK
jgi:head-tail adaptor